MSAAEHAIPQRPGVMNKGEPAPVIDLDGRRHGALRTVRGRWAKAMTTHGGGPAGEVPGGAERDPLEEWAESIERSFLEARLSLAQPGTAAAFLRSLDVFERTLQGFQAGGVITAEQLAELTAAVHGMRQVPRIIAPR